MPQELQSQCQSISLSQIPSRSVAPGDRFRKLVSDWKSATLLMSSIPEMAMHPAYQQIIGMGKDALPLLFEEMRRSPDHWFWALQAITGENPVAIQDGGDVAKMTEAWLAWAREQGL